MSELDDVSISDLLQRLGLTEYEAKTLSSLFRVQEAEAPEISRLAQVPKTRVYDVLDRLIKKSLVIEIYGRPKKYRVVEAGQAIEELIENKKREIRHLEEKASNLKEFIQSWGKVPREEGERVMKVKDTHDFEKILSQEIESAKSSVLAFTEINREGSWLKNALAAAAKNKVNVKVLGSFSKDAGERAKNLAKSGVKVKHFEHDLSAFVIDGEKVVMGLSDFKKEKPEYHFSIWNKNPSLSNALKFYFNDCWSRGKNL